LLSADYQVEVRVCRCFVCVCRIVLGWEVESLTKHMTPWSGFSPQIYTT
jgi:hypothetical protein